MAWEQHNRWIDEQAERYKSNPHLGMDAHDVTPARTLAGEPKDGGPE